MRNIYDKTELIAAIVLQFPYTKPKAVAYTFASNNCLLNSKPTAFSMEIGGTALY